MTCMNALRAAPLGIAVAVAPGASVLTPQAVSSVARPARRTYWPAAPGKDLMQPQPACNSRLRGDLPALNRWASAAHRANILAGPGNVLTYVKPDPQRPWQESAEFLKDTCKARRLHSKLGTACAARHARYPASRG